MLKVPQTLSSCRCIAAAVDLLTVARKKHLDSEPNCREEFEEISLEADSKIRPAEDTGNLPRSTSGAEMKASRLLDLPGMMLCVAELVNQLKTTRRIDDADACMVSQ